MCSRLIRRVSFGHRLWSASHGAQRLRRPQQPPRTLHLRFRRRQLGEVLEIEQEYPGFAEEMQALLSQGFLDRIAADTVTGAGSGKPYGLATRLDATTTSEVTFQTSSTFAAQEVFKVWNALPERFRSRSSWLMSVSAESAIRALGAGPNPSAYITVDLTADGISMLNGRPVHVTDYMPSWPVLGTTPHTPFAIVGDFKQYLIAMRLGMASERVAHLFSTTNARPVGMRGFFSWARAGADVVATNGLRLLNNV